jgi:hypothetical protein
MREADLLDEPRTKPAPSLEYKPDPQMMVKVSVRGFRLFLALTLLNTTLLASSVLGPQLFPFLRTSWVQWQQQRAKEKARVQAVQAFLAARQQCLDHEFPPGTLLYEEDPVGALRLRRDGGVAYEQAQRVANGYPRGWVPPVAATTPTYFKTLQSTLPTVMADGALLFLHERTTPGGAKYVVAVRFAGRTDFRNRNDPDSSGLRVIYNRTKSRTLVASAWLAPPAAEVQSGKAATGQFFERQYRLQLPDTFQHVAAQVLQGPGSDRVRPPIDYGNILRFHGGRVDPNDPSHFTIPYQLDGRDGVIEGRVKDDAIELRPRDGEWKFDNGEVLRLDAPPATQPVIYPPQPVSD